MASARLEDLNPHRLDRIAVIVDTRGGHGGDDDLEFDYFFEIAQVSHVFFRRLR